ncbi:MAG: methylated-DNA--[protein]-cysteine S-methyltransferase [Deltaproteobacteria bacterium]|nr:methylated-DNA--[protein]-cysteine S-methyltransferase [Deltaproteobacteria bacterium]
MIEGAIHQAIFSTPLGPFKVKACEEGVFFSQFQEENTALQAPKQDLLFELGLQIKEYFAGRRQTFQFPVKLEGTDFQKKVWKALEKLPYGQVLTYEALTESLGPLSAIRAVASAVGKNPLPLLIPCHRVLRKNGGLGGFSQGLWRKERLLQIEGLRPALF